MTRFNVLVARKFKVAGQDDWNILEVFAENKVKAKWAAARQLVVAGAVTEAELSNYRFTIEGSNA